MDAKKLRRASTPARLAAYAAKLSNAHGAPAHQGHAESIREADHDGHRIVIHTTYEVWVDGKKLAAPLSVDNSGHLHCHTLPNYQFVSAIDAIKALIDNFPEEFTKKRGKKAPRKKAASSHSHRHPRAKRPAKSRRKGGR